MADMEEKKDEREDRNVQINPNTPEILTNNIYDVKTQKRC